MYSTNTTKIKTIFLQYTQLVQPLLNSMIHYQQSEKQSDIRLPLTYFISQKP